MRVIVVKNYREMSAKAAHLVLSQIREKPNSVLGLATGSTILGLYQELVKSFQNKKANFKSVATFNLDEYVGLVRNHNQSYRYFIWHNLFSKINIKKENVFIPDGLVSKDKIKNYCQKYDKKINKYGGIDLQILGIGRNGHIGFNEPGNSFKSITHLTKLSQSTIQANSRFFKNASQVPHYAITMGLATIMRAKKIILLASGKDKADAVFKATKGKIGQDIPASILQQHPNITFIIDEAAASKLKRKYK